MIKLEFQSSFLRFRHPFRIAHGERLGTDVVFLRLELDGFVGYGEATLPPYLGVTTTHVIEALSHEGLRDALQLDRPQDWHSALQQMIPDLMPALAALDMARWQVHLSQCKTTVSRAMGDSREHGVQVAHSYTIGVCNKSLMEEKIRYATEKGFSFFKLKLDGVNDLDVLRNFRLLSKAPFAVDANQAWGQLEQALPVLDTLEREGCVLIEQPFHMSDRENSYQLSQRTKIPVIADEACQGFNDLEEVLQAFDGVNVKLQKCGGITPAWRQLEYTRGRGGSTLIGCMSESSIGCNAAEQLTYLCDWADLDGPHLNANNEELCKMVGYSL